eukprot:scaffold65764_cov36-Tisochrysis_lutea.AAC.1
MASAAAEDTREKAAARVNVRENGAGILLCCAGEQHQFSEAAALLKEMGKIWALPHADWAGTVDAALKIGGNGRLHVRARLARRPAAALGRSRLGVHEGLVEVKADGEALGRSACAQLPSARALVEDP